MARLKRLWKVRNVLYGLLLVGLPALGIFQYHWITQLSEREYDHTRSVLQLSAIQIANGYAQDIFQIRQSLQSSGVRPEGHVFPMPHFAQENSATIGEAELLETARRYLDSLPSTRVAEDLSLDVVHIAFVSQGGALESAAYSYGSHAFGSVVNLDSATAALTTDSISPRELVWRKTITNARHEPVSFYVRAELSQAYFTHLLDSLVSRSLPGEESQDTSYAAAVARSDSGTQTVIYSSQRDISWSSPDVAAPIVGMRMDPRFMRRGFGRGSGSRASDSFGAMPRFRAGLENGAVVPGEWMLLIKGTHGSVLTSIRQLRMRNLFISFGILLALGASIVFLVISNARASRLAEQQVRFFAGISHELRTPIAVIRSASENISDGIITDRERLMVYGQMIRRETDNLWEMVERVLQYASLKNTAQRTVKVTDVNQLIRDAVARCEQAATRSGARIKVDLTQEPLPVEGDPGAIQSSIENLLMNAIKYGRSERPIEIATRKTARKGTPSVAITVRDYGSGIPEAEQSSIFEPFYRGTNAENSHERGNGLGLSLVRSAVEMHHGSVSLDSSPGEGTAFTIILPRVDQPT